MWQTSAFLFRLYFNNFEICSVFVRLLLVSLFGEKFTAAKMISFSSFFSKWVPHRTFLTCQLSLLRVELHLNAIKNFSFWWFDKKIVLNESWNDFLFFCSRLESLLGLTRDRMIFMALVLGCDFFPTGIPGGAGNPCMAAKSQGWVALPRMAEIESHSRNLGYD